MRFLYGVCGEGLGHAARSEAVIHYLLSKGHRVTILASGRAHQYLRRRFRDVHEIPHLPLVYEDGRLCHARSALRILKEFLAQYAGTIRRLSSLAAKKRPDVAVSDFEVFTSIIASRHGAPLISAENISHPYLLRMSGWPAGTTLLGRWYERLAMLSATRGAAYHVIPSFAGGVPRRPGVLVTSPPVRPAIRSLRPRNGTHVLVYQTSETCTRLLQRLARLPGEFIIYGFGSRPRQDNLSFFANNDSLFPRHLAAAKAVITGGGFTLISEALYLRKPVFSAPLERHVEQNVNGLLLEQAGLGEWGLDPGVERLRAFLARLPRYRRRLAGYTPDPDQFARTIEALAARLAGGERGPTNPQQGSSRTA